MPGIVSGYTNYLHFYQILKITERRIGTNFSKIVIFYLVREKRKKEITKYRVQFGLKRYNQRSEIFQIVLKIV